MGIGRRISGSNVLAPSSGNFDVGDMLDEQHSHPCGQSNTTVRQMSLLGFVIFIATTLQ